MANMRTPRKGSMQFWPRVRANRPYARVRSWEQAKNFKDAVPLGFAGYKAGMTHIVVTDNRKTSTTKGMALSMPVTVIECPPLKVYGIRFYKYSDTKYGLEVATEITSKADKDLSRKLPTTKQDHKEKLSRITPDVLKNYVDIRLLVYTQPRLTAIGNKKPEIFEIGIGGKLENKFNFAKEILGKEIFVENVAKEGQQLDFHAVTIGKGFQGPVKRFGVAIRRHKSEKTKRGPASLGPWCGQGHIMYRVAHAGRMGFSQRTEFNKWLIKIEKDTSKINPAGGFVRFGFVKNPYILVKGSVAGPEKRIVRFNLATRPSKKIPAEAPSIQYISLTSKQGD